MTDKSKKKYEPAPKGYEYIFRRYRKDAKTGELLDARRYGYKAWCMLVPIGGQGGNPQP